MAITIISASLQQQQQHSARRSDKNRIYWLLTIVAGLFLPTVMNLVQRNYTAKVLKGISSSVAITRTTTTAVTTNRTVPAITTNNPFARIVLMGQFNYAPLPNELIVQWDQTMKQIGFAKVLIRGEFTNKTRIAELQALGLNIATTSSRSGARQSGWFSPYINLRDVLLELQEQQQQQQESGDVNDDVDGVLYLHDDSIPHLRVLAKIFKQTKNQAIVGTDLGKPGFRAANLDASYENPRRVPLDDKYKEEQWRKRQMIYSYRMYPQRETMGDAFRDVFGEKSFASMGELNTILQRWGMRVAGKRCAYGQWGFAKDIQHTQKYQEEAEEEQDGYLYFPSYTQADFLYMPLKYTQEYVELATLLYQHGVWLECAIPTIVDQLVHLQNATVFVTQLCTHWGGWRGKYELIHSCGWSGGFDDEMSDPFGLYHPIKIGPDGVSWQKAFDEINGNWTLL